jgi:hypothetical protein
MVKGKSASVGLRGEEATQKKFELVKYLCFIIDTCNVFQCAL